MKHFSPELEDGVNPHVQCEGLDLEVSIQTDNADGRKTGSRYDELIRISQVEDDSIANSEATTKMSNLLSLLKGFDQIIADNSYKEECSTSESFGDDQKKSRNFIKTSFSRLLKKNSQVHNNLNQIDPGQSFHLSQTTKEKKKGKIKLSESIKPLWISRKVMFGNEVVDSSNSWKSRNEKCLMAKANKQTNFQLATSDNIISSESRTSSKGSSSQSRIEKKELQNFCIDNRIEYTGRIGFENGIQIFDAEREDINVSTGRMADQETVEEPRVKAPANKRIFHKDIMTNGEKCYAGSEQVKI